MATQDRLPTGNGIQNNWASATGGNKWDDVDDPIGTPDDDTTYITENTDFQIQEFSFAAFDITATAGTIDVSITHRCKGASGTQAVTGSMRVGASLYTVGTNNFGTNYSNYEFVQLTNPKSGSDWTEAEVEGIDATNPLQRFGVRSGNISDVVSCTQSYCTVTYTEAGGGTSLTPTVGSLAASGIASVNDKGIIVPTEVV